jgi:hypothetical protein
MTCDLEDCPLYKKIRRRNSYILFIINGGATFIIFTYVIIRMIMYAHLFIIDMTIYSLIAAIFIAFIGIKMEDEIKKRYKDVV